MMLMACGNKGNSQKAEVVDETEETEALDSSQPEEAEAEVVDKPFDFSIYEKTFLENAEELYYVDDEPIRFIDYAFIDIDGDGKMEVWVRSGQGYEGVYAIDGDNAEQLSRADNCSVLVFYKGAVGYNGDYGTGVSREGYSVVKNSRLADSFTMEHQFNVYSDEHETLEENYTHNSESITGEEFQQLKNQLGETIEPKVTWIPVTQSGSGD